MHGPIRRRTVACGSGRCSLNGPDASPTSSDESETLWSLIEELFDAGDAMPTPLPAGKTSPREEHQQPPDS